MITRSPKTQHGVSSSSARNPDAQQSMSGARRRSVAHTAVGVSLSSSVANVASGGGSSGTHTAVVYATATVPTEAVKIPAERNDEEGACGVDTRVTPSECVPYTLEEHRMNTDKSNDTFYTNTKVCDAGLFENYYRLCTVDEDNHAQRRENITRGSVVENVYIPKNVHTNKVINKKNIANNILAKNKNNLNSNVISHDYMNSRTNVSAHDSLKANFANFNLSDNEKPNSQFRSNAHGVRSYNMPANIVQNDNDTNFPYSNFCSQNVGDFLSCARGSSNVCSQTSAENYNNYSAGQQHFSRNYNNGNVAGSALPLNGNNLNQEQVLNCHNNMFCANNTIPFSSNVSVREFLSKFNGVNINPVSYLMRLEFVFQNLGLPLNSFLISAPSVLEGEAASWFFENCSFFSNYVDFKQAFLEEYWGISQQRALRRVIDSGVYDPTNGSFASYFNRLASQALYLRPPYDEPYLIRSLAAHFPPHIASGLAGVRSIRDALALLRDLDEIHARRETVPGVGRPYRPSVRFPTTQSFGAQATAGVSSGAVSRRGVENRPQVSCIQEAEVFPPENISFSENDQRPL